jgi:putative transposase
MLKKGAVKVATPTTWPITANPRIRKLLAQIVHSKTKNKALLVERANLILKMLDGANNTRAALALNLHRDTARQWRQRWLEAIPRLHQVEAQISLEDDAALLVVLAEILSDAPRSGAPGTFRAEQIVGMVTIACEDPRASDYPISHWTPGEIAREAVKRKIVTSISAGSVGRFLKGGQNQAAPASLLA